jgi:hypothetical protein
VFRRGFCWPSIIDDASKLVTTCQACQKFLLNAQAFVAATEMGHQYSGTIDNSIRKLQICCSGSGIFLKMDRGEASSQYSSSRA